MRVIIIFLTCALPSSTRSVELLPDCAPQCAVYAGQEVEILWQEYEDGKSPEALMVKDFDKVRWNLRDHSPTWLIPKEFTRQTNSCSKKGDLVILLKIMLLTAAGDDSASTRV